MPTCRTTLRWSSWPSPRSSSGGSQDFRRPGGRRHHADRQDGFLLYRATITAIVAVVVTTGAVCLVAPWLGPASGVLLALSVAVEAVLAAVLVPAVARNKVEGLALTKLTIIAAVVPLVALVPSPWRIPRRHPSDLLGRRNAKPRSGTAALDHRLCCFVDACGLVCCPGSAFQRAGRVSQEHSLAAAEAKRGRAR